MRALALLLVMLAGPAMAHGEWSWMMGNANPAIRACCGEDDCHPVAIDDAVEQEDGSFLARFTLDGETYFAAVAARNTRFVPVDVDTDHGWVCVYMGFVRNAEPGSVVKGRCLFRPPQMF